MPITTRPIPAVTGHGFPNLALVRDSINLLYKSLPDSVINSFARCFPPKQAFIPSDTDIVVGVQLLAAALARHLQLPRGCVIVNFRDIDCPGRVELTPEDDYIVELRSKYRDDHRDIAAILAHEVTHIFLHRHRIAKPDTFENEVLTDTAAVYFGVGWLCLDAFRLTEKREERQVGLNGREVKTQTLEERLGYLTPDEFGYVLGKRSEAFRDRPTGLIGSPAGKSALDRGYRRALQDYRCPPLAGCRWWSRWQYYINRMVVQRIDGRKGSRPKPRDFGAYRLESSEETHVVFECPVCNQRLRLPTGHRLQATCAVCRFAFECRT